MKPLIQEKVVNSSLHLPLARWCKDPLKCGKLAFRSYLDPEIQKKLKQCTDLPLMIRTDRMDIPFELMHDGSEHLCLSRPAARQLFTIQSPEEHEQIRATTVYALIIGDPTDDLPEARQEAMAIAKMLKAKGIKVTALIGSKQATRARFRREISSGKYHFVHFAGHGIFNQKNPKQSAIYFLRNGKHVRFMAEEFRRQLGSPSFFFFNACEVSSVEKETTSILYEGHFLYNLAIGALEGGACGCLGPMWKVKDHEAKEFALEFYKKLLDDELPIGEAVRQARLKIKNQFPNSTIWASWILFGNPTIHPLRLSSIYKTN